MNGKGDRNRSDPDKYAKGWSYIFERKRKRKKPRRPKNDPRGESQDKRDA